MAESWTTVSTPPEKSGACQKAFCFSEVLNDELDQIALLRHKRGQPTKESKQTGNGPAAIFRRAHEMNLVGLAFSGGGIRSATFNLGVLQGLAKYGCLAIFDYLSTVSGGGYIGSWFEAWIFRAGMKAKQDFEKAHGKADFPESMEGDGFRTVAAQLRPERTLREQVTREVRQEKETGKGEKEQTEPPQIRFLREYSNYLTPRVGILGADTWTMLTIYLRNLLLNQAILTFFLFFLLLLPQIAVWITKNVTDWKCLGTTWLAPAIVILLTTLGLLLAAANLEDLGECACRQKEAQKWWRLQSQGAVIFWVALPHFLAAWILTGWIWCHPEFWNANEHLRHWAVGGFLAIGVPWCVARLFARKPTGPSPLEGASKIPWLAWMLPTVVSGPVGGLLLYFVAYKIFAWLHQMNGQRWHELALGVPLVLIVYLVSASLQMGLMGKEFVDPFREWWSRLAGWLFILTIVWAIGFGLAIYAPLGVMWLRNWVITAGFTWIGTTAVGVLGGKSGKTGDDTGKSGDASRQAKLSLALSVTPYVFIIGLASLLALSLELILVRLNWGVTLQGPWCEFLSKNPAVEKVVNWVVTLTGSISSSGILLSGTTHSQAAKAGLPSYVAAHWQLLDATQNVWLWLYCGTALAAAVLLSWRVNLNEFSLNYFYRNRLVRCYLGASHEGRTPNPFSGFDHCDDFYLTNLQPSECYAGPYPIFNATLNLVSGSNLAWQERKAESFAMTPRRCGYDTWLERVALFDDEAQGQLGEGMELFAYRPTQDFAYSNGGPFVGTTVSISGAALSPNMGYHSSPSLAMLMTFFNVRLGFWAGNPRHSDAWKNPGPQLGLRHLLVELFGLTSDEAKYVYLSDGGHFENLGIYELVKRRCKYIIACDAGADPDYSLDDLGSAIRKCREDLGVEIELNTQPVVLSGSGGGNGNGKDGGKTQGQKRKLTKWHCAFGTIRYDMIDTLPLTEGEKKTEDLKGVFVYLKASLTGDEPADVLNYQTTHKDFPHETTADQWFTESQFESYRRLGQHVVETLLDPQEDKTAPPEGTPLSPEPLKGKVSGIDDLFTQLKERWQPTKKTEAAPNHSFWDEFLKKLSSQAIQELFDWMKKKLTPGKKEPS